MDNETMEFALLLHRHPEMIESLKEFLQLMSSADQETREKALQTLQGKI